MATVTQLTYRATKYDLATDLEPIASVAKTPMLFVVQTAHGPKTLAKALALALAQAQARPDGQAASGIARLQRFYFDTALSSRPYALPSLLAFAHPQHISFDSHWPCTSPACSTSLHSATHSATPSTGATWNSCFRGWRQVPASQHPTARPKKSARADHRLNARATGYNGLPSGGGSTLHAAEVGSLVHVTRAVVFGPCGVAANRTGMHYSLAIAGQQGLGQGFWGCAFFVPVFQGG